MSLLIRQPRKGMKELQRALTRLEWGVADEVEGEGERVDVLFLWLGDHPSGGQRGLTRCEGGCNRWIRDYEAHEGRGR